MRYNSGAKQVGTMIEPTKPRATVTEDPERLRITIPAKRNWLLIPFLSLWLCGWLVGEVAVPLSLITGSDPRHAPPFLFAVVWLTLWTVGGGFALYTLFWQLFGKQMIVINPATLTIREAVIRPVRSRQLDLTQVRDLRVSPMSFNPWDYGGAMQFWGIGGGVMAFDYGAKTYRFGAGVDEAEAKQLVHQVKRRFAIRDG
jgi:hypothetical protein